MGHPDHDLVRAGLGGELDRLVEHRDHHVEALERELLLAEEGAAQVLLEPSARESCSSRRRALLATERLAVAARTRSPGAARRARRGRRCARSRTRSCRSRPPAGPGAPRAASRPGRARAAARPGSAPAAPGSAAGSSRVSSSAGSPSGSEPSGSSRAARCPCVRCALTSAAAAATAAEQRLVDLGGLRRAPVPAAATRLGAGGSLGGRRRDGGVGAGEPLPRRASPAAGAGRDGWRRARCRRSRRAPATPRERRPGSRGSPRAGAGRIRRSARRRRGRSQRVL